MRYLFGFLCVCALGVFPLVGCSETSGGGGSGGSAGTGGVAGTGGMAGRGGAGGSAGSGGMGGDSGSGGTDLCEGVTCEDTECKIDGVCDAGDGMCDYTLVEDGTTCTGGECLDGVCAPIGAFSCTEQGIRDAIAEGVGPHFFACDGPTTVVTAETIAIDNDVILDGEGNLTVDGNQDHLVFFIPEGVTAELHNLTVTGGSGPGGGLTNRGTLTLVGVTVSGNRCAGDYFCFPAGIFNNGALTIEGSTIAGNPVGAAALLTSDAGTVSITNSTLSHYSWGVMSIGSTVRLTHSTIVGGDAALFSTPNAPTTTKGSLIVGGCLEAVGDYTSKGYNIESPLDTCGFDQEGDQVNISAEALNLGELAANGGPTKTHAPLTEPTVSVAIDHIPGDACLDAEGAPLLTDQRGEPRPVAILGPDPMCDVGSVEVQP